MGKSSEPNSLRVLHIISDFLILNVCFLISYQIKFNTFIIAEDQYFILAAVSNIFWILLNFKWDLSVSERGKKFQRILIKIVKMVTTHTLLMLAIIVAFKLHHISRIHLFLNYTLFFTFLTLWKLFFYNILRYARVLGFNYRKVVIVGEGPITYSLHEYFNMHLSNGFKFMGYFADNAENIDYPAFLKGKISEVKDFCLSEDVDEIYCAIPFSNNEVISDLIKFSDNNMIRLRLVPDFRSFLNKKIEIDFFDDIPVMSLRKEPLGDLFNRFNKRTFDIVFSLLVIIGIFPILFPIIALLIKLTSKGPVFFKQLRSGRDNKDFICYKFRSMALNEDSDRLQAVRGDARITWIGNILRKTSMDELPQFFNVLLGQMSVVGPRPHMLKHTQEYSQVVDQFMVRHFVKPGITGLAQVKGLRGDTNHPDSMKRRVQYDLYYLENWNFTFDLKIIIKTVVNMIKGQETAF
jgi:putative colanic acid biosynthesis UDP-glucose lipid carrier transferase